MIDNRRGQVLDARLVDQAVIFFHRLDQVAGTGHELGRRFPWKGRKKDRGKGRSGGDYEKAVVEDRDCDTYR